MKISEYENGLPNKDSYFLFENEEGTKKAKLQSYIDPRTLSCIDITNYLNNKIVQNDGYTLHEFNTYTIHGIITLRLIVNVINPINHWYEKSISGLPKLAFNRDIRSSIAAWGVASATPLVYKIDDSDSLYFAYGQKNIDYHFTISYPIHPDYLNNFLNEIE